MNDLNKISVFKGCKQINPALEVTVQDFCICVKNGDFADDILKLRNEPDETKRKQRKQGVPAVTISGTFTQRAKANLIRHSGFICLDFDQKQNPDVTDWPALRNSLSGYENIYFAALSASGKGLFLVIPILNSDKHEQHFRALEIDFKSLGLITDPSCKDVSRLRFASYDPQSEINRNADTYRKIFEPTPTINRNYSNNGTKPLDRLIEKLIRAGVDITSGYSNWFEIGRALVNCYGESGRVYFHQLSRLYPEYKPQEADRQYNHCLKSPGAATESTIFELAKQNNIYLK